MGVDHRRCDVFMAEQRLHRPDVGAGLEELFGLCGTAGAGTTGAMRAVVLNQRPGSNRIIRNYSAFNYGNLESTPR